MIPWNKPDLGKQEEKYLLDALHSTWISDGEFVNKFEAKLKDFLGAGHAISVSNGTTALHLAYLTLGLGPGDEVIVPGYTFAAPANMAMAVGATPVFVDVSKNSWTIDPKEIRKAITPRTKAIVVVHLYGYVANMDEILKIADEHKLYIVEDNAEGLFSKYKDQYTGTVGTIGCLSFQATKTITTGEGGAVLIKDKTLADRARLIRNHGMRPEKKYWHEVIGHNFRMTNLQAAVGLAQLERAEEIISKRQQIHKTYTENLQGLHYSAQTPEPNTTPLLWALTIKLSNQDQREGLKEALKKQGIETRTGFYCFEEMPLYSTSPLPNSMDLSRGVLSLPTFATISAEEIGKVCEITDAFLHKL